MCFSLSVKWLHVKSDKVESQTDKCYNNINELKYMQGMYKYNLIDILAHAYILATLGNTQQNSCCTATNHQENYPN